MLVMPAVDLRGGACVQLVGGDPAREAVRLPDPSAAAAHWVAQGFGTLHVVDLDAALGSGENRAACARIAATPGVTSVQVGGGMRSEDAVRAAFETGATRVIVGTRALEDNAWLASIAHAYPARIVVAADVRDGALVSRGWRTTLAEPLADAITRFNTLPLAALLVTAVHREGLMQGTDLALFEQLARDSTHPVQASGGIATLDDLRALDRLGIAAAVLGMSLYTGALDARLIAREYA